MSSNKSPNMKIHLWNPTDPFKLEEMNYNFQAIDKAFESRGINVEWFGAKGDGKTDDTKAIQDAINFAKNKYKENGATIFFGHGEYNFKEVYVTSKHIKLTGTGVLNGTIIIQSVKKANPNNDNNILDLFTRIEGLKFIGSNGNMNDAIRIINTRCVYISNCFFQNFRYGIHGESIHDNVPYQQTARVTINDCMFYDVDSAVRTTWAPWNQFVPSTWRYGQHGDWQVKGCQIYFYKRGTTHFHFEGQDGLICTNNIMFHQLYRLKNSLKKHNIYLKQSNFAIISNNDMFEAGEEAILCEDNRNLIISNNNIAWPGQKDFKSGIRIETIDTSTYPESSIIISNNNITYPTHHGIYVGQKVINCKISDNIITNIGNPRFYYGSKDLTSLPHYSVFINKSGNTISSSNIVISNNVTDKMTSLESSNLENDPNNKNPIDLVSKKISGVLTLNNSINSSIPFIIKNCYGVITSILNGDVGQLITIICQNNSKLILNHSGTSNNSLNIGENISLNSNQYVTLLKTDTYWIKL